MESVLPGGLGRSGIIICLEGRYCREFTFVQTAEGRELAFMTSAVESDSGEEDAQGIFITRHSFRK